MQATEISILLAAASRSKKHNTLSIRLKRDEEMSLEERQAQCKALEYGGHVAGMFADVAGDFGSIPDVKDVAVIGKTVEKYAAPVAIVGHIVSGGIDIAKTALDCDDIPFDEIKKILDEKFNELDRKLDKNTAALEEVSKIVSKTFTTVEKTRAEMNENFRLVIDTIESKEIKLIVFKIDDFKKFFDKERQRIKGLSKDKYVSKLLEQRGILSSLKDVRVPSGNSLSSALNELLDKNNNYAIPKVVDDNKAFQALYALFYGTQTYASVMYFLLEQHSYLADYYYQKGDDEAFNRQFDLVSNIFDDFKFSLTGGNDGLIDNVIEVLKTVKDKSFMKDSDSKLYRDIVNRTNTLNDLKTQIKTTKLPLIDDIPQNPVQISFPEEDALSTPIGEWVDGAKVRYAVQYESEGKYSKFSEWTDPFTVEGKASPFLKVPVDKKRRNRLIFRKFNSEKHQFAGVMSHTQTNFRDIDRDLYNAVLNVNENKALDEVTCLLQKGANIDSKFDNNRSAMHAVALRGNSNVALRFLLNNEETDIELRDKKGYTPLHIAAEAGQSGFVKLLINHGTDVNSKTENNKLTALHLSTSNGFAKTVKSLLESPNINVNQKEDGGFTPLHTAVMGGYRVLNALLQHKDIDKNAQSNTGLTPFHLAIINENQEVAETLVEYDADVNVQDFNHMAPIHFAASLGSMKMLKYLLSIKVNINSVAENNNWSPLHFAIYFKQEDVALELLKQEDADLTIVAEGDLTLLHLAVSKGQINIVKELLNRVSNLEDKTSEGYTPLHLGAMRKEPEMALLLIEKGANLEARAADNSTPLHLTAKTGRKTTLLNLLEKGADIEAKTEDGSTALHLAAAGRKINIVQALLQKGANSREFDNHNYLPIHRAIINDDKDMLRLFIDQDPTITNDDTEEGRTSIKLIVQKIVTSMYNYYINNYNETESREEILNRFDEEGKLELAYMIHNKDGAKTELRSAFLFLLAAVKYCLEEKRKEAGSSGDPQANSLQSPNSSQCLTQFSQSVFRRSVPEIIKETSGIRNFARSDNLRLSDLSHSFEKLLPSGKLVGHKYNFKRSATIVNDFDAHGTLLLLDILTRKFTKEKYNSAGEDSVSELGAKAAALDITSKFEDLLSEVKGIPAGEVVDMAEVNSNIYKAITSGNPVLKVLCSYVDTFPELNPQQIDELVGAYLSKKPPIIPSASEEYQKLPHLLTTVCLEPQRMSRSLVMKLKNFLL